MFDFDLLYILTHPLLRAIYVRCAELTEMAHRLPKGSEQRKIIESRISRLEEYRLPKPDRLEQRQHRQIKDLHGQVIAEVRSLRHRFNEKRRGRPAEYRLQARAALEDKCANRKLKWSYLTKKYSNRAMGFRYEFKDTSELKRAVRRLKVLLKQEGIPLPPSNAYRS